MTRVGVIATGGTIASRFDPEKGSVGASSSREMLEGIAAARLPGIDLEITDFCSIGSYMLTLEQAFALARKIDEIAGRDDIAGVVVTHGTDTLEESAYLADLTLGHSKPVVFTGAQRAADDPESDGPRNFLDAVRVAAAPQARDRGVLVVFEEEIHAARDVTKTHTSQVRTFQSGEHGKLGEIDRGRVILHRDPLIRGVFECTRVEPKVDLIKLVIGADGRFVDCALQTGARGIVLEAFGRGNVTPDLLLGVRRAVAAGVPVVVTSRCPRGRVAPVYGESGGAGLAKAHALFAGDLSGIKARILLSVLLGEPGYHGRLDECVQMIAA